MKLYLLIIMGVIAYFALLLTALLSAATKTTDYFLHFFVLFFIILCIGFKIFFSFYAARSARKEKINEFRMASK